MIEYKNDKFYYIRNNKLHQKSIGVTAEKIRGKTPYEVFGEVEGQEVVSNYRKCVELRETVTYQHTFQFIPGERIWLTSITPVIKEQNVRFLVISSKDITEFKQLEKEHEEVLERLQSMFSKHMAVMLILEPETGKILDANPAACDFYGYSKEELLSLSIQDINILPKEEVARLRALALQKNQKYFVFPHRLKSGEIKLLDVYSCPIQFGNKTVLYSILFDVTDREKLREALNHEKERLRITLKSIGDGVVTTDIAGMISSMNESATAITGWSEEDAKYKPFVSVFDLRREKTGESVQSPIEIVLQTGKTVAMEEHSILIKKDGEAVAIADSAAPIKHENGQILGAVMVFRDVSRERAQQEQILYLSYHDALTGLYNRRFMEEEMRRLDKPEYLPLSVIMGDVNGLKLANDVFGHEQGDQLLRGIAESLKANCRTTDRIARWGGDEFLILLPRTSPEKAESIMNGINEYCSSYRRDLVQLSIALGCATKQKQESMESLIQEAEEKMYRHKMIQGKLFKELLIESVLNTLYEKSLETMEHKRRMETYCRDIGRKLKLSEREMRDLLLLDEIHNIGMVGIKHELIMTRKTITMDEWDEIKKHPEIGYRIALYTQKYAGIAEYVLAHHEYWNGEGYPRGLKGENIPLLSRILAVVDAFDAMTSERVYRNAITKMEALEELKKKAGIQFDPMIVDQFVKTVAG